MRRQRMRRRGGIMFCVLACMAIVMTMTGLIVRDAMRCRREAKLRWQLRQTDYLLDAGLVRATTRKQRDPAYDGETWLPALASTELPAKVEIDATSETIRVTARIGLEPHITTKSYTYSLSEDK